MRSMMGALFAILLSAASASASARFDDGAGIFNATASDIQAAAARWTFELRVITGSYPSRAALESAVHRCVSSPNVVCIGIDPGHRFTVTHFGTAAGVQAADFAQVSAAGNPRFRQGDWAGGVTAIADSAAAVSRARVITPPAAPVAPVIDARLVRNVVAEAPRPTTSAPEESHWFLWTLFAFAFFGTGVWLWLRAAHRERERLEAEGRRERERAARAKQAVAGEKCSNCASTSTKMVNGVLQCASCGTPRAVPKPSAPIYVAPVFRGEPAPRPMRVEHHHHHSGSGGRSGFTDGLLVGQALARPAPVVVVAPPARVIEREIVRERESADAGGAGSSFDAPSPAPSFDSGGSGSSFDSDSGGSSSSWDSGSSDSGSSDSGSSDSGGGGGDF